MARREKMTNFKIDDLDPEVDKSFICLISLNAEIGDIYGTEPGRTARLERLVREGLIEPFYEVTEKGRKFAGI
jgi:hypothetical protein